MAPLHYQENHERKGHSSGSKDQPLPPSEPQYDSLVKVGPQARQKRGRNFGVGGCVKAGIDCGKEGLFFGEGRTARGAFGEMRAQLTLRGFAGGGCFD
jgi:hypothetical protein